MTDWCILNTAPTSTLNLASSLNDAGHEAWTPTLIEQRRARSGDKPVPVPVPLLPSFVFARAVHLGDLIVLSRSPSLIYRVWDKDLRRMVARGVPKFYPFRLAGIYPLVPDRQLNALRRAEEVGRPKGEVRSYGLGESVRAISGGFEGLAGKVIKVHRKRVWVMFKGWRLPVEVEPWLLLPGIDAELAAHVSPAHSQAPSAKAA